MGMLLDKKRHKQRVAILGKMQTLRSMARQSQSHNPAIEITARVAAMKRKQGKGKKRAWKPEDEL
jgi:hypothetical protein